MFKDVVLEITNAKASSPPDAQPAFTTIPTPVPTVTPAKIVDKSIFCDCGTRGPIASNKSYNTEKVIEATIEYIRIFTENLYPTKSSKPSITTFAIAGCILNKFLTVVKYLTLHLLLCCLNNKNYKLQMLILLNLKI